MTNNYEILDEEQKVDCRQALMNSLQMMIQAYVITNELIICLSLLYSKP